MINRPFHVFSRLLSLTLAFTLALAPTVSTARALNGSAARANEVNFPTEASPDPLHLRGQTFNVGSELPPYDKFAFTIENGLLTARQGEAIHRFDDIEVVGFEDDHDVLTIFARSGDVFSISKYLIRGVIFEGPLPVALMQRSRGELKRPIEDYEVVTTTEKNLRELQARYGDRLEVDLDYTWTAGNVLLIENDGQKRRVVHEVHRGVVADDLAAINESIEYYTDMYHRYGRRKSGERSATDVYRRAERNAEIPLEAAQAFQQLSRETLQRLPIDRAYWMTHATRDRDMFRLRGDVATKVPEGWADRRKITKTDMLRLAAATLGGSALVVGAARWGFGPEYAHVVHATFTHWMGLISPVWLDTKYRAVLARGVLWMSLVPVVAWATYFVLDRTVTKLNNTFLTQVQTGMRVMAALNEPFWRRAAQLMRQPHLIKAASLRAWPWKTVSPESDLGRRAGIDQPTQVGWIKSREDNDRTNRVLRTIEQIKADRFTFTHWLAKVVVGEDQRLSPEVLDRLLKTDSPAAAEALLVSHEANRWRLQLAHELDLKLSNRPATFDVNRLTPEQLETEKRRARRYLAKIRARSPGRARKDIIGFESSSVADTAFDGLYTYARAQNRFWRTARPEPKVAEMVLSLEVPDYYGGLIYTASIGPRANLSDPASLMANSAGFLSMNRAALYAFFDTKRWYMWNQPAKTSAIYQQESVIDYEAYDAREGKLTPKYKGAGFVRSTKWFLKDMANPSTGRYGEVVLDQLVLSGNMIQSTFLLTTMMRWLFAGVTFANAASNYLFHLMAGHLVFGAILDVVQPTIDRTHARAKEYRDRTEAATGKLDRGLRLQNEEMWTEGMREAIALYDDPEARSAPATYDFIRRMDARLAVGPAAEDARQVMWSVLEHPPLPGKEPKWLMRTASVFATVVMTYIGLKVDVMMFRPGFDWPHLLAQAAVGSTIAYSTIALLTKGWRYFQAKQKHACEMNLLDPGTRDMINAIR